MQPRLQERGCAWQAHGGLHEPQRRQSGRGEGRVPLAAATGDRDTPKPTTSEPDAHEPLTNWLNGTTMQLTDRDALVAGPESRPPPLLERFGRRRRDDDTARAEISPGAPSSCVLWTRRSAITT